jgi:hypothetical protein
MLSVDWLKDQWSVRIASQQTTSNIKDQWSARIASQQTTSNIKDQWSARIASHWMLSVDWLSSPTIDL